MTSLERALRNLGGCDLPIATEAANRIAELEQQLAAKDAEIESLKASVYGVREYLEKLACLGNGTRHGNSVGNVLAIEALDAIDKDLSGYILCDAEPVAWDYKGKELWYFATDEEKMAATPLYKAKEK